MRKVLMVFLASALALPLLAALSQTKETRLVSFYDLNCSFFIFEGERPEIKITGAERGDEKILFADRDIVFINSGKQQGIEPGLVCSVIEFGPRIKGFGRIAFRRAKAKILEATDDRATARLEAACAPVQIGHSLIITPEKPEIFGENKGYASASVDELTPTGQVIYLQRGFELAAIGHWALIDLGAAQDLEVGQQVFIFRRQGEGTSPKILANAVVVDCQTNTATIKLLSVSDPVQHGDFVQPHRSSKKHGSDGPGQPSIDTFRGFW